ncbi:CoA pyrophosphatase [Erwinia amylovora]|uniref:Nudix hydrolase 15, mitochondrial n=4 Tax=Erwinia amylovora TaxID=552 RepID=A0A831A2X7_ERWAM|nr:CoA pyrophosphatase [Erwinia amylovora]CBX80885.1 Nudix hydrolase 15, mitochondrial precursor [Erwinia amylovora ATCC BAA-2158]CDK15476.1 Nudix hydrolase 15 [Erwinia amylovora LA635]CDK18843.1 Nudix hydrolase 15 [Erwinia amylovora LA636]CDK22213.1 Nudix hydrolase 15 [Erwinia amylovora LA637]ATZ11767.1 CoA pyrophosphatase [Erwinia amylovora]
MDPEHTLLQRFLTRFLLQPPVTQTHSNLPRRQAAVLVPVIAHAAPTLLLTRRAATLRQHAGQVAFPGGVRDSDDRSPIATALREAQEEVAIPPEAVRVIGVLPPVTSSTGFQVTPVVGLLPADICWQPNEGEVESVFEMPLAEALRLSRYTPLDIQRAGQLHRVWLSWYEDYFIWGMTAGIIRQLSLQVANSELGK